MTISLSIITINYNNCEALKQTIKSVVSQDFNAFEYIVIDGGSSDGSISVIKDYETHINYWISEPDKGIYHAMNKGTKIAQGDFVLFLNSGDLFYDNHVVKNTISTLTPDDELVYGDVLLRHNRNRWERLQIHPKTLPFSYFYNGTICQQACFIKRSLFSSIFYFDENLKIKADWEFLMHAIYIKNVNLRKIDVIIAIYDMDGISSTPKLRSIANEEREQILTKHFPLFKDDYKQLKSYGSPRFAQLLRIEQSVFLRRIVSVFFKCILFFLPKTKS